MQYILMLLVAVCPLGLCYGADKGFTTLFRGRPQHNSGRCVRVNRKYAVAGILLAVLGLSSLFNMGESKLFLFAGILLIPTGIFLIIYYMSFGIYYDDDGFLYSSFGKKSVAYEYGQIRGQQLYSASGSIVIELHMEDGSTVSLQAGMPGIYPFLDEAFAGWCRQTEHDPENCSFHDPANTCYFPPMEEL